MYNFVIVGYGEIASKAHTPAIEQRADCNIQAIVDINPTAASLLLSKSSKKKNIPCYTSLSSALQQHPDINAASICTPQSATMDYAYESVELYGLHTLLEKPPGDHTRLPRLLEIAKEKNVTVFTAYHSTVPPGIPYIQEWVQQNHSSITKIKIEWKENVRKWHPNQQWVTTRDGLGVLDILFNPISLLVYVLPNGPPQFVSANLIRPSNWQSPISGTVSMLSTSSTTGQRSIPIGAEFAWDYEPSLTKTDPEEIWDISFEATTTTSSKITTMVIKDGGAQVYIDDDRVTTEPTADYMIGPEYVNLYSRFVHLIQQGESYVDGKTPSLIHEIMEQGKWSVTKEYKI